jgi:hypothetical protein
MLLGPGDVVWTHDKANCSTCLLFPPLLSVPVSQETPFTKNRGETNIDLTHLFLTALGSLEVSLFESTLFLFGLLVF